MTQVPRLGPALLKKRLGEELRRLRHTAEVTVPQTAAELGSSEAKVRHMENGRNVPSKPDLTVMIALYGASKDQHRELEELRQAASRRGWWSSYRLPTWLHNLVGMEADARLIRTFELELIPGLLQTPAYARELHNFGPIPLDSAAIDRSVAARLKRQERIVNDPGVELHAVISEAAFHRIRDRDLTTEQCRHLLSMAKLPNVTILVLPFSKGLHPSPSGSFVLLDFPPNVSTPVGYVEYAYGGQLEHDPKIVARLSEVYSELVDRSLNAEESFEFINNWI